MTEAQKNSEHEMSECVGSSSKRSSALVEHRMRMTTIINSLHLYFDDLCTPEDSMAEFAIPQCAVCGRLVQRIERYEDIMTQENVFTVTCHGEREVTRLSHADQVNARRIQMGMAFTGSANRKRIGK